MSLQKALDDIEKRFGKGAAIKMDERPSFERTSSGSLKFDKALGGGYPVGKIIEFYGEEQTGKSGWALAAIREVQKKGGKCVYVDAEYTLDVAYAEANGVNTNELILIQPNNGDEAIEMVRALINSEEIRMVIVDSVAALIPKAELEGEAGEAKMGLHARLMSQFMRQITGTSDKNKCTVIFINQLRDKIGGYVVGKTTTGGNALKFYASVRVEIKKSTAIKDGDKEIGFLQKISITKNKCSASVKEPFEIDIIRGIGVDSLKELIDVCVECEIVTKKGAWYSYGDVKLGMGIEKTKITLNDNPELVEELKEKVKEVWK